MVDICVLNICICILNVFFFNFIIFRYKDVYVFCIKIDFFIFFYVVDVRLKNVINVIKFEFEINSICSMDILDLNLVMLMMFFSLVLVV